MSDAAREKDIKEVMHGEAWELDATICELDTLLSASNDAHLHLRALRKEMCQRLEMLRAILKND